MQYWQMMERVVEYRADCNLWRNDPQCDKFGNEECIDHALVLDHDFDDGGHHYFSDSHGHYLFDVHDYYVIVAGNGLRGRRRQLENDNFHGVKKHFKDFGTRNKITKLRKRMNSYLCCTKTRESRSKTSEKSMELI